MALNPSLEMTSRSISVIPMRAASAAFNGAARSLSRAGRLEPALSEANGATREGSSFPYKVDLRIGISHFGCAN